MRAAGALDPTSALPAPLGRLVAAALPASGPAAPDGAEVALDRVALARFALVGFQLALAVLVIERFQIASRAFFHVSVLALAGFAVHAWLPFRYRLPFFALLSMGAIGMVLGPRAAAWLLGVGLGLIGLCHLPVAPAARAGLLVAAGAGLAALRLDWMSAPWSGAIWPVLGSMFMFRLIIYAFDLRHEKEPPYLWRTLSYFFLLPNVCFALFPVVDYRTFRRTYYAGEPYAVYQVGVQWIARGIVQLLCYRLVYYYAMLDPADVAGWDDLGRYLLANIGLYLRVSGMFHIAIGMLRLFGFALPETHYLYFAAASVNDFWRRINIYWKDFMLKVFYYPMFFRLRRRGVERAIVLSTLFVLVATWMLHSYQWFWLRGTFPLRWQDGVFWGALGALMIANSLYEMRHSQARGRRARAWNVRGSLARGARIAALFSFVCVLWSLWTAESLEEWLGLFAFLGEAGPGPARAGAAPPSAGGTALALALLPALAFGNRGPLRGALPTAAALLVLAAVSTPAVYARLEGPAGELVQSLRTAKLNRRDAAKLQRGYYEELVSVERFNSQLWQVYRARPTHWLPLRETSAARPTGDDLIRELAPDTEIEFKGAPFRTNRWGMRDRDYSRVKPAGTYRVALLGASYVMGAGVADGETFEAELETQLNAEGPGAPERRYEVLNFAVAGYSPAQQLLTLERKVFDFEPDAVVYVAHENEVDRYLRHAAQTLRAGVEPSHPFLARVLREAGVDAGTTDLTLDRRLRPRGREVVGWVYARIAEACRARGVRPVWVYLPTIEMYGEDTDALDFGALAERAGFSSIALVGVYDGHDPFAIRIADWDHHPNARGHRLIARRLFGEITPLLQ